VSTARRWRLRWLHAVAYAALLIPLSLTSVPLARAEPEDAPASSPNYRVDDIYEALKRGDLPKAREMIHRVLQQHPGSSKAHYVAAEVYAKSHDFPAARSELKRAEELQPGLPSVDPRAVAELRRQLAVK
jgi:Tfp pilus assembly protein PilF